jgi:hypothetical protein
VKHVLAGLTLSALAFIGSTTVLATAPAAGAGTVVKAQLMAAVKQLPVAAENRQGYDRDKFRIWVDADHDCRDTRDEVLAAEDLVRASGCDVQRGMWTSYYDGVTTGDSSGFDIDHLVPLAEAWDSGATRWSPRTRERYANDLGDPRTLVAVTAASNRSKSDRDPAEWLPALAQCRYVRQWVAVKIRWSLKVDRAEKRALTSRALSCANVLITVRRASIATGTASAGGPSTGGGPTGGGSGGAGGGTDPRFAYCYQATAAGYGPYYQGRDPEYPWYTDSDHDGVVCES